MVDLRCAGDELQIQRYDPDELLDFVVGVESQFYPQIGELYQRRIEAWAAAQREKLALDRLKKAELSPSD